MSTTYKTGWIPDRDGTEKYWASVASRSTCEQSSGVRQSTTPIYVGDVLGAADQKAEFADVFNYRALAWCLNQPVLSSMNQGDAGSCVGHGTAIASETALAVAVVKRSGAQWTHRVARDAQYALGRTLTHSLGGWDGSTGWAAVLSVHQAGLIFERVYQVAGQPLDLSRYSARRAQQLARDGVPQSVIEEAKATPVVQVVRVLTVEDAIRVLRAGGGINICSSIGYKGRRDARGFIRRSGTWNHSMGCTSLRHTGGDGFLIHQSWGDDWTTGPYWPEDQPRGSFWATPEDLLVMLRQRESYGYLMPTAAAVAGYVDAR